MVEDLDKTTKSKPSLKTQGTWLTFAKIVAFAFSALLPLLVIRYLSQENFGIYQMVFRVIANAAAILPLGFGMSAYYFLGRDPEQRPAAIANILLFSFVVGGLACLTLFVYPGLIGGIFHSEEVTRLTPMIGIAIWLWLFSSFLEIAAVANQEPKMATVFIILAQFTKTLLMAAAVIIFTTVEAFLYAAIIQTAIQTLILLFYLNSRFPTLWRSFDPTFFRKHFWYALPYGITGILWTFQLDIHNYFVGYRFSASEFAIYAVGCFQLPLIFILIESVNAVMIPRMSQLEAVGDKREMISLSVRAVQKLAFFNFPAFVFLFIVAETFIITLFTDKYEASIPIFLINISLIPFHIWITDAVVRAYEDLGRKLLFYRVLIFIGMVLALWFGINNFNLVGMILVLAAATVAEKFVSLFFVVRKLEARWNDAKQLKDIGKTAVCSILAGILSYFVYGNIRDVMHIPAKGLFALFMDAPKKGVDFTAGLLTMGITGLVFGVIYLVAMNYWGAIDPEEKQTVRNLLSKVSGFVRGNRENKIDAALTQENNA